jgi:hypothetical protein
MGVLRPSAFETWLAASCQASGVERKVVDASALRDVGALLATAAGTRTARQRGRGRAASSGAPDGPDPVEVEAAGSGGAGLDDDVVEQGPDDGGLSREGEAGPLVA